MREIDAAAARLAAQQFGAFSREQILSAGGTRRGCDRRLASGAWRRTRHRRVYTLPASADTWRQRLWAALLAAPPGAVVSHRAAAVLHGFWSGTFVELAVPRGSQHRLHALVHQIDVGGDRTSVEGIPVTSVERTIVDLATVVGDDALERAVEAALRKGVTTADRLRSQLEPYRRGAARLRQVLDRRGAGRPMGSELEVRFLQLLRAAGLADPARQHEVRLEREPYFVDFAYPDQRLCIELDGREWHDGAAFQRDRTRQNALVLAGWTVLRFTWDDVLERGDEVVATITQAVRACAGASSAAGGR